MASGWPTWRLFWYKSAILGLPGRPRGRGGGGGWEGAPGVELMREGACEVGSGIDLMRAGACEVGSGIGLMRAGACEVAYGIGLMRAGACELGSGVDLMRAGACEVGRQGLCSRGAPTPFGTARKTLAERAISPYEREQLPPVVVPPPLEACLGS